jgi:hypothetical protein
MVNPKGPTKTLEDMLRAYIIDFGGRWDSHMPFAGFSYNNGYHSSIGRTTYEMLYGRGCRHLFAGERLVKKN